MRAIFFLLLAGQSLINLTSYSFFMRTINLVLLMGIIMLLLPGISFADAVMGCTELSTSLTLANNLEGAPIDAAPLSGTVCVKIIASNLIFDCNGYNITNNGTGGTTYGILLNGSITNVTVKNCGNIGGYYHGVYVYDSDYNSIMNNTLYSNPYYGIYLDASNNNNITENNIQYSEEGIRLSESSSNRVENNTAENNGEYGFLLQTDSNNNHLSNNTANANDRAGFYVYDSDNNAILDNIAYDHNYYGIWIQYSNNNSLVRNIANTQCQPTTYHLSQLGSSGTWSELYSSPFEAKYSTKEFQFSKTEGSITLRITQNGLAPFADIDAARLNACGFEVAPAYAKYTDSGESVLEDLISIDNNVVVAHEKEIEVSWDIPGSCNEPATLFLTANEYLTGLPLFFPNIGYATISENAYVPVIDGNIGETDGLAAPAYTALWRTDSGHPEGYLYVYTGQDEENAYVSLDITPDNTNEFGEDWVELAFITANGKKAFRVDDYNDKYGKCGFGLTNKVPYKHQTCEFSIPKSEIGGGELRFMLRYYGTGSLESSAILVDNGENNIVQENTMSQSLCGNGALLYRSNNNNLSDNIADGNSRNGIYLSMSSDNRLTNNNISGNIQRGTFIQDSNQTLISGDHYFNNTVDLRVESTSSNLFIINLANVVFDNPLGNLVNYTRLSLSDSADATGAYSISWVQTPSSPPNQSFEYKTLDISLISGTVSIDSLSMNWLDSELSGYNENGFQIWKYDEVWTNMNAALNAAANTLTLTNFVPASYYSILQGEAPATTSSSSSGETSKKTLKFNSTAVCPGDFVDVYAYSSFDGISGVNIRMALTTPYEGLIAQDETADSGHVKFHLTKPGTYTFDASALGYTKPEPITLEFTPCVVETVPNVTSNATQNETSGAPPPLVLPPECTVDSDCAQEKYCSNNNCTLVVGSCGYAANHVWTNYECCDDSGCDSFHACKENKCALKSFEISGSGGYVGDNATITLYSDGSPLANTQLKLTKPDGSYEILTTDSNGQIIFPLSLAGEYTIELMSGGTKLSSLSFEALAKPLPPEAPMSIFDVIAQAAGGLLLLLLLFLILLVGAFLAFKFFFSKGKGYKK